MDEGGEAVDGGCGQEYPEAQTAVSHTTRSPINKSH